MFGICDDRAERVQPPFACKIKCFAVQVEVATHVLMEALSIAVAAAVAETVAVGRDVCSLC